MDRNTLLHEPSQSPQAMHALVHTPRGAPRGTPQSMGARTEPGARAPYGPPCTMQNARGPHGAPRAVGRCLHHALHMCPGLDQAKLTATELGLLLPDLACSWTYAGSSLRFYGSWTLYFGPNRNIFLTAPKSKHW